jgi:inorganic pyrophosphatase
MEYEIIFWEYLEKLVQENEIIIDRPKGTNHPKYNNIIYPIDYGYIKNTKSMDNGGIDIFLGSDPHKKIDTLISTIDMVKNDSEIKILIGCTEDEKLIIYNFLNNSDFMKAIFVKRQTCT